MKLKVNEQVVGRDGTPLFRQIVDKDKSGKPIENENGSYKTKTVPDTFRQMISDLLDTPDKEETGEIKSKINQIQDKLWRSDEPDFTVDQLHTIKEKAGKFATPLAYGIIERLIEKK